MAIPAICPTCASPFETAAFQSELVLAHPTSGEIVAAQRNSVGRCPKCGPRIAQHKHMGHHSTLSETEMKRRYPKSVWEKMKAQLTPEDWRRWQSALHGQVWPTNEDKARWDASAQS